MWIDASRPIIWIIYSQYVLLSVNAVTDYHSQRQEKRFSANRQFLHDESTKFSHGKEKIFLSWNIVLSFNSLCSIYQGMSVFLSHELCMDSLNDLWKSWIVELARRTAWSSLIEWLLLDEKKIECVLVGGYFKGGFS